MFRNLAVNIRLLSKSAPADLLGFSSSLRGTITAVPSRFLGRMERAVVRCVPSKSKLTITFILDGSHKQMLRDQSEQLGKALARIANNAVKGHAKAKKSKKNKRDQSSVSEPVVRLYFKDDVVAEDALNSAAWQDGAVLHVGDTKYKVEWNPPTFTDVELPASLLAGFPVCPKLEIEFGYLKDCTFQWFKEIRPNAEKEGEGENSWVEVCHDRVFIPSNVDIGLKLKLKCTPGNNNHRYGVARELITSGSVEAGPGTCTFDSRHLYTNRVTDESTVRAVSYNILADIYAQTELSKTVLYPYCAPYALDIDYRQNLLKKELAGYNADVICLQEVDKSVFTHSLSPALDAFDLDGLYRIKDKQHEGLATYFRRSKFTLLSQHDVTLSEALLSDLLEKVSLSPAVRDKVVQRSTTLQVTFLQCVKDPSRKLCVANTHLYWHPKGGYVRLIQMAVALQHIERVLSELHPGATLLLLGDMNSMPSSGLYELLNRALCRSCTPLSGAEEVCLALSHSLTLSSACGEPAYTNYVGGFHGCLDYVFMDTRALAMEQVIPLPSHEEVTTHQALPSVAHPSDHIALVCDLRWK
ncbi:hypothetical protein AOXY_G19142 [Acipenser oxyrinchus oxyrinchus]|uniref:2',5'-phosphodiesterase 12 n=1 Tax=Acipenser oxyrinchus oxyrinchus TaxID=40147 RepID=A0AAD8D2Q6_ACIOX|nr:hypothetical protein AOXY_G19142 [Acipenser oxyrinchus oxyrinchus]